MSADFSGFFPVWRQQVVDLARRIGCYLFKHIPEVGELVNFTYCPTRNRKKEIPKSSGKTRTLGIPTIKDRVVQGALKLILEPIFEADFQSGYPVSIIQGSYIFLDGTRIPQKSRQLVFEFQRQNQPHQAPVYAILWAKLSCSIYRKTIYENLECSKTLFHEYNLLNSVLIV